MKKVFIESRSFTSEVQGFLDDETYATFQNLLMENPGEGAVMAGCGGLRKVRLPDPRRGKRKRGGARVIYLHIPEADWVFLLDIYSKGAKEDLNAAEKRVLKRLAQDLKKEALRSVSKKTGDESE